MSFGFGFKGIPEAENVHDEEFLAHVFPSVARYTINWSLYTRKLCRLVVQTVFPGNGKKNLPA